jgi:hypothetical protein
LENIIYTIINLWEIVMQKNHAAVKDIYNEMYWSSLTHAEKVKEGP